MEHDKMSPNTRRVTRSSPELRVEWDTIEAYWSMTIRYWFYWKNLGRSFSWTWDEFVVALDQLKWLMLLLLTCFFFYNFVSRNNIINSTQCLTTVHCTYLVRTNFLKSTWILRSPARSWENWEALQNVAPDGRHGSGSFTRYPTCCEFQETAR